MAFSHWLESVFSSNKFNSGKALRHTHKENYDSIKNDLHFNEIFLDLARTEIEKTNRLLYIEDIDKLTQKARIMSRHKSRDFTPKTISEETIKDSSIEAFSTIPLRPEFYSRLSKQLQNIKYTTNTYTEFQGHHLRTLRLKNAQETIIKIIEEMSLENKSKRNTSEMERTLRIEINRWTNFAETIHKRLYRKISQIDFKDYVEQFEQSFLRANRQH